MSVKKIFTDKQVSDIRKAVKRHNEKFSTQLVASEVIQLAHIYNPYFIIFEYLKNPTEAFYEAIEKLTNKGKKSKWVTKKKQIILLLKF